MTLEEIEKELAKYPDMPTHNKQVLRDMLLNGTIEDDWDKFWDNEEAVNKDSNRYHDDN